MNEIKGAFRNKLRERPFDFYVAFVIFLAGAYSLFSDSWPENLHEQSTQILITLVSAYMVLASLVIMSALLCNRKKRPVFAVMAEMWGWLAVSAASTATFLMYEFMLLTSGIGDMGVSLVLSLIWLGMALASFFRSLDIYLLIRRSR